MWGRAHLGKPSETAPGSPTLAVGIYRQVGGESAVEAQEAVEPTLVILLEAGVPLRFLPSASSLAALDSSSRSLSSAVKEM
jgi:hypothetical protein